MSISRVIPYIDYMLEFFFFCSCSYEITTEKTEVLIQQKDHAELRRKNYKNTVIVSLSKKNRKLHLWHVIYLYAEIILAKVNCVADIFHNVSILKMYVTTCSSQTNVKVTFQIGILCLSVCLCSIAHIDSHGRIHRRVRISDLSLVFYGFMFYRYIIQESKADMAKQVGGCSLESNECVVQDAGNVFQMFSFFPLFFTRPHC